MNPQNPTDDDAVLLVQIMRRKALQLNELFHTKEWTPRKIDKILWTLGHDDRCNLFLGGLSQGNEVVPLLVVVLHPIAGTFFEVDGRLLSGHVDNNFTGNTASCE